MVYRETFFPRDEAVEPSALPDLMAHCGERHQDVTSISDPTAIVEVVSPTFEQRDRMDKRAACQALVSLQPYVLIERDRMFVDLDTRRDDGWHGAPQLTRPDDLLRLPALDFAMSLAEVYAGVIDGSEGKEARRDGGRCVLRRRLTAPTRPAP